MLFQNSPTDPRILTSTDFWDSPENQAQGPVVSFHARCFRLLVPIKSVIGPERYAQLAKLMERPPTPRYPAIDADTHRLMITTGPLLTAVNWSMVDGITAADFPTHPEACDFAVYVYTRRGPRIAYGTKATMRAIPF